MAVSGLMLVAFLLVHMYGNTKAFISQEAFDDYAHHLRVLGEPMLPENGFLWIFRIVMLTAILGHIYSAMVLSHRNSAARDGRYAVKKKSASTTYASRTMRWGGVIVLLFLVFHILQFTTNTIRVKGDHASPYMRMMDGFSVPWVTAFYLLALVLLAFHVRHGVWSALQTLGLSTKKHEPVINVVATAIGLIVLVGFATVPVSVMTNILS